MEAPKVTLDETTESYFINESFPPMSRNEIIKAMSELQEEYATLDCRMLAYKTHQYELDAKISNIKAAMTRLDIRNIQYQRMLDTANNAQ